MSFKPQNCKRAGFVQELSVYMLKAFHDSWNWLSLEPAENEYAFSRLRVFLTEVGVRLMTTPLPLLVALSHAKNQECP